MDGKHTGPQDPLNVKDYVVCVQHRCVHIHRYNTVYSNKITGHIKLAECMTKLGQQNLRI